MVGPTAAGPGAGATDGEDAAAIRRCLAGDREAFGGIVQRYEGRVYGLALRYAAGSREDAADITQETFVRAFAALGRFLVERPLLPWLLRIAANACRDAARRKAVRPPAVNDLDWEALADAASGPAALAEAAQERRQLRAAVAGLPAEQRLLVVLAYDRELSLSEIARILGLPLSMVKNRLFRARRRLAAALRDGGTGGTSPDGLHERAAPLGPLGPR